MCPALKQASSTVHLLNRLLDGLASVQDLPLPAVLAACTLPDPGPSATIAAATATSHHVALHLSTGAVGLLLLEGEGTAARLRGVQEAAGRLALDSGMDADDGQRVTAVCVAEDTCQWLGQVGEAVPSQCKQGVLVLCRYNLLGEGKSCLFVCCVCAFCCVKRQQGTLCQSCLCVNHARATTQTTQAIGCCRAVRRRVSVARCGLPRSG